MPAKWAATSSLHPLGLAAWLWAPKTWGAASESHSVQRRERVAAPAWTPTPGGWRSWSSLSYADCGHSTQRSLALLQQQIAKFSLFLSVVLFCWAKAPAAGRGRGSSRRVCCLISYRLYLETFHEIAVYMLIRRRKTRTEAGIGSSPWPSPVTYHHVGIKPRECFNSFLTQNLSIIFNSSFFIKRKKETRVQAGVCGRRVCDVPCAATASCLCGADSLFIETQNRLFCNILWNIKTLMV